MALSSFGLRFESFFVFQFVFKGFDFLSGVFFASSNSFPSSFIAICGRCTRKWTCYIHKLLLALCFQEKYSKDTMPCRLQGLEKTSFRRGLFSPKTSSKWRRSLEPEVEGGALGNKIFSPKSTRKEQRTNNHQERKPRVTLPTNQPKRKPSQQVEGEP